MNQPKIPFVACGNEKRRTYSELRVKAKISFATNHYRETIELSYALLEDRLTSILIHLGIIKDRVALCACPDAIGSPLRDKLIDENGRPKRLTSIGSKIAIIETFLKKVKKGEEEGFSFAVYALIKLAEYPIKIGEYLGLLREINKWRKIRNEVVHAQFNKSLSELETEVASEAKSGLELSKRIDSMAKFLRRPKKLDTSQ